MTDDIDIDYFYCDPLEDFKAYLYNNVLVMFGSWFIDYVPDARIILPQDFNCVIGGALPPQDMLNPMLSGYPMVSTEYGWGFDAEVIASEETVYLSIFATHVEE